MMTSVTQVLIYTNSFGGGGDLLFCEGKVHEMQRKVEGVVIYLVREKKTEKTFRLNTGLS